MFDEIFTKNAKHSTTNSKGNQRILVNKVFIQAMYFISKCYNQLWTQTVVSLNVSKIKIE